MKKINFLVLTVLSASMISSAFANRGKMKKDNITVEGEGNSFQN